MQMPDVVNRIEDSTTGVVYEVVAYSTLSRAETVAAVRAALSSMGRRKKPKKGDVIRIMTVLGADR